MAIAGPWTFTNGIRTSILKSDVVVLDGDSFNIALFTQASNVGPSINNYAALTGEVANGNGYTTGGKAITLTGSGTTAVSVTSSAPTTWTAAGGSITAYYAVIYKAGGEVLCYCTLANPAANVTVTDGNTLSVIMNSSGIFVLS